MAKKSNPDVFLRAAAALATLSDNAVVVLLMRHGEKERVPKKAQASNHPGVHDIELRLTERGKADSQIMGRLLMDKIVRIEHSEVPRCRQTAECMAHGAQFTGQMIENPMLVGEGFVPKHETMTKAKKAVGGFVPLIDHLAAHDGYPGYNPTRASVHALIRHLLPNAKPGINVNVSHDWFLYLVLYVLGIETKSFSEGSVNYLEPLFLWQEDGRLLFHYRHVQSVCDFSFTTTTGENQR